MMSINKSTQNKTQNSELTTLSLGVTFMYFKTFPKVYSGQKITTNCIKRDIVKSTFTFIVS
jgi:hypothetical protein